MLTSLHIRDYAVVEDLELDLRDGLTVVTGETGAGKSILVGALSLVLGDRADSSIVRHGSKRSEIIVSIDISDNADARDWLTGQQLDDEGECLLRRTVSSEGRSRAWINGSPVNLTQLRSLGEQLIDIHGQHEHQSLLKKDQQRLLLDQALKDHGLLEKVGNRYHQWQRLQHEYENLSQAAGQCEQRLELLRFQVRELEALAITTDEISSLEQDHKRLANADQLIACCRDSLRELDEEDSSLTARLSHITRGLQQLQNSDAQLATITALLEGANIQLQEAAGELRHHFDELDPDPERMQQIEQRLGLLHDIARKHHVGITELPALSRKLRVELDDLEHAGQRLDSLQIEIDKAAVEYRTQAEQLSSQRRKAASRLGKQVSDIMATLGMPEGRLDIAVESHDSFSAHGMDRIEFMVATNPAQPLKALSKIVSGGELSRISLALQVIMAGDHGIPTLVFDEVDVGIGGRVAGIVGQKLRILASQRQILCITHLPQVAAQGHHHLRVAKQNKDHGASTTIETLNSEQRSDEIARMLGGIKITEQTRAHAQEMIEQSNRQTVGLEP